MKLNELEADSNVGDIIEQTKNEMSLDLEDLMVHTKDIGGELDHENCCHIQSEMLHESNDTYSTSGDGNSYDDHDVNDSENNEDDDDILEFINIFDESNDKKLHSSSILSIYDACIKIIKLACDLNLNRKQILCLSHGIYVLLPPDIKLLCTVAYWLKIVREYCFSCNIMSVHANYVLSSLLWRLIVQKSHLLLL